MLQVSANETDLDTRNLYSSLLLNSGPKNEFSRGAIAVFRILSWLEIRFLAHCIIL